MEIKYEEYLDRGTRRIMELFSSADISAEERDAVVSAFTDELAGSVTNTENLRDCDLLIYSASVRFVDSEISRILSKENASYGDYETGKKYCARQQQLFSLFRQNGWALPGVENSSPEKCAELFQKKQESISIGSKIQDEDRCIDELVTLAEIELSVGTCDRLTDMINELEQDISVCKQKHMPVPDINNKDTQRVLRRVAEIKKNAEQKEIAHREIYNTDLQIDSVLSYPATMPDQWRNLISLCQKQTGLLAECRNRQWPLPSVRYNQPDRISEQYRHYLDMLDLDNVITREKASLSKNKQYKEFFGHCNKQQENISVCMRNGWSIPKLGNPDPGSLSNAIHAKKIKKERYRRFKYKVYLAGGFFAAVAVLILFGISKYRAGKIEIPFDASYAIGQDQAAICKELEDAGFKSITKKQDDSGWLKADEVISVTIDNSDNFSKGSYRNPDARVVITYSGGNRVYVTDLLKGWKNTEYTEIENTLKDAGFTTVKVTPIATEKKSQNRLVSGILLNNEEFIAGECYLSITASIEIKYYSLQIKIGQTATQFEKDQIYSDVVKQLQSQGFTNIHLQRANDIGWFPIHDKEGTIKIFTINGSEDFAETDKFSYDAEILIVVHTQKDKGCEDITEIAD